MISKPVPAHSFYHTCRYIMNKQGAEVILMEGVRGHDYKLMAADFERQQQLRPGKEVACFHSIVSFHPSEKPSDELMKIIVQEYLQQLGIVNTQYAVCKHTDKAHLHLHVVANMVNNDGKAISDSWIGLRGKKIAQELTLRHELVPAHEKNLSLTHTEAMNGLEATKYKIFQIITEQLPQARSIEGLELILRKHGVDTLYKFKSQTREVQGISFKLGEYNFKGSSIDRKFSFGNLVKTIQLQQNQALNPQQSHEQKPETQRQSSYQKTIQSHRVPSPSTHSPEKNLEKEIAQGLWKITEILFQPEYGSSNLPYEFTQAAYENEAKKRKRQKQQQDHSLSH